VETTNRAGCKDLAFKVLNPEPTCNTSVDELDSIRHEVTCLIHVGKHPNIIKYLGMFSLSDKEEEDLHLCRHPSKPRLQWAFATEYLHGGNVAAAVSKKPFIESKARQVIADVLSALTHIHRHGVVHRDVKGPNILLADDGQAVLADFGIAAFVDDKASMSKRCGTPGYTAPEVLPSEPLYGIKVDSFSAGVVLYSMICGRIPFEGNDAAAVLRNTIRCQVSFDGHSEFSQVSGPCKEFILQLLQKKPRNRLSAEEAVSQLWCTEPMLNGVVCEDKMLHSVSLPADEQFDFQPMVSHGSSGPKGRGWCGKFRQLISKSRRQNTDDQHLDGQFDESLTLSHFCNPGSTSPVDSTSVTSTDCWTSKPPSTSPSNKQTEIADLHTPRPPSWKPDNPKPWSRSFRINPLRKHVRNSSRSGIT